MLKGRVGWKVLAAIVTVLVGLALLAGSLPALAGQPAGNSAACPGLGIGRYGGSLASIVSDILGISLQDLAKERQAGKSLLDIAAARNVDKEQLVKAVTENRQARLEQLLEEGKITQTQYDQCMGNMKNRVEQNLARTQTGPNGQGPRKSQTCAQGQGQGNAWKAGCQRGACYGYGRTNNQ